VECKKEVKNVASRKTTSLNSPRWSRSSSPTWDCAPPWNGRRGRPRLIADRRGTRCRIPCNGPLSPG